MAKLQGGNLDHCASAGPDNPTCACPTFPLLFKGSGFTHITIVDIMVIFPVIAIHTYVSIHDTLSRGGRAGAVMCWAGAVASAVYTTASVTCNWAGAVMQKSLAKRRKSKGGTDRPAD